MDNYNELLGSLHDEDAWNGSGSVTTTDYGRLLKALQANYVDSNSNTGNFGALQPQSFEKTLILLTFNTNEFRLWRDIPKTAARQLVEEYAVQIGYGQGESFVDQMETPLESDPLFERGFGRVRFARETWKVSDVSGMVDSIADSEIVAKRSATMRLLRNISAKLYSGDNSLVSQESDGFETIIRNQSGANNIIDLRGELPTQETFDDLTEVIRQQFFTANGAGLYCSPGGLKTLSQIFKQGPSGSIQRVLQPDGTLGYAIKDIVTNFGTIIPKDDVFITREYEGRTVPKISDPNDKKSLIEGATSVRAPATPTFSLSVQAPTVVGSKWASTGQRPAAAGYQYRVCAGNQYGRSAAQALDTAGAVAANGSITVTITPGATTGYRATYFEVFSELVAGSGIFWSIGKVKANTSGTTAFVDLNQRIPGTTMMFLLPFGSGEDRTFAYKRLAPLYNKQLAPIGMYKWGIMNLMGVPQFYQPLRYAMVENVPVGLVNKSNLIEI